MHAAAAYTDSNSTNRTASGSTTLDSSGSNIVRQTTSGTSTYYIYDAQGNVQGEHIGSTSYYYLHNNISSIVAVVGSTGTVSDRYAYDPYGNVTASSGTVANPWQFAGGYYDASTGLTKFGNRYYDSTSVRWIQADILSGNLTNPQSLNRFVYAGNDPVNEVDPSGAFGNPVDVICGNGPSALCTANAQASVAVQATACANDPYACGEGYTTGQICDAASLVVQFIPDLGLFARLALAAPCAIYTSRS